MSERRLFLGVDGGGTKTEFLCIDEAGAVLARHREATTYHLQVGLSGAEKVVRSGIGAICATLAIDPGAFSFVFFGLPAFGEDSVVDPQLERFCGEALSHERYRCGNDMICGWAGSLGCQDGINLVAGTGSIAYGERHGRSARAGGWGEVFGDEGSAYWIAIQGLNAFTRMSDGRRAKGPLYGALTEALSLESDLDICARIMGDPGLERDGIAALALVVAQAATAGDAAALSILDEAAGHLAAMAHALRRTLGYGDEETASISWSGGVLTNIAPVRTKLRAQLEGAGGYAIVEPRHSPAYGAALYARRLFGASK